MKKILKLCSFISVPYGEVGTPTPIKDNNGTELKVGDLVFIKAINKEEYTVYQLAHIICYKNKYFAIGAEKRFNDDGTYKDLTIEKVLDCEELNIGDTVFYPNFYIKCCEEVENKEESNE